MRFAALHALVVGGSGGMGRAVCSRLRDEGCQVTATGATDDEVTALVADPKLSGIRAERLDVRDHGAVTGLINRLDRLDVLINLAGIGRGPSEFTDEGFEQTVDINLNGTMRTCYAARPLLEERGGAIVNTASMMSFFGSGTAPAYASSKGGVVQFTKSLAITLGPQGVRVNAVAPGWIETPMTVGIFADSARRSTILSRTPLGRLGAPGDVAEAVCFLAAPSSSFITAAVLPVDGGYLAV